MTCKEGTMVPFTLDALKEIACEAISKSADDLNSVSQAIWNNPELNYKEHKCHSILTDFLANKGFPVERKHVVDTAFRSVYGEGPGPNVAVCCEYDALPEIGHACGHNLIAEVGVGAAIGIKAAMDAAGRPMGKVGKIISSQNVFTLYNFYTYRVAIYTGFFMYTVQYIVM